MADSNKNWKHCMNQKYFSALGISWFCVLFIQLPHKMWINLLKHIILTDKAVNRRCAESTPATPPPLKFLSNYDLNNDYE